MDVKTYTMTEVEIWFGTTLRDTLKEQATKFEPAGWVLMQCHVLDSSRVGEKWMMPVGGKATWQEVPEQPVSKRGLASDMAVAVGWLPRGEVA